MRRSTTKVDSGATTPSSGPPPRKSPPNLRRWPITFLTLSMLLVSMEEVRPSPDPFRIIPPLSAIVRSSLVFSGSILEETAVLPQDKIDLAHLFDYKIAVEEVWKGNLGDTLTMPCMGRLSQSGPHLFFANRHFGAWWLHHRWTRPDSLVPDELAALARLDVRGDPARVDSCIMAILHEDLRSDRDSVRLASIKALLEIRGERIDLAPFLRRVLRNGTESLRLDALNLAGGRARYDESWKEVVSDCLRDPSPKVRAKSVEVMFRYDLSSQERFSVFLDAVRDTSAASRVTALRSVGMRGMRYFKEAPEREMMAARTAVALLRDPEPDVRVAAAVLLGSEAERAPWALAGLLDATTDTSVKVRVSVLEAIGEFSADEDGVVECILAGLNDDSAEIRTASTVAIRNLPDFDQPELFMEPVKAALLDTSRIVRMCAIQTIAQLGPSDETRSTLLDAMESGDFYIQWLALKSLTTEAAYDDLSLRAVREGLAGPRRLRLFTTRVLGRLARDSPDAAKMLRELLTDSDEGVRAVAAKHIRRNAKSKE